MNGVDEYKVKLSLPDIVGLNDSINFEISCLEEKNYNPSIEPSDELKNNARIAHLRSIKQRLIDAVVDSMAER